MSLSHLMHAAHAFHMLSHQKHEREKKLEAERKRLEKIREKLSVRLDDFFRGKQVKVRKLSGDFLRQAVVVDSERKKLEVLRQKLDTTKRSKFANKSQERQIAHRSIVQ